MSVSRSDPHVIKPAAPEWSRPVFSRLLISTLGSILILVAVLNFVVNPFRLYPTRLFPRVEVNNYEEKLALFNSYQPPPEVLILGSSRVMSFDPEVVTRLTGKRCFNFALPGAKTETYYAVLRIALSAGAPIDTVIVGVEPEALHPTLPIEPEARFVSEYSRFFTRDSHGQASFQERLALLLTLDQTTESISSIQRILKKRAGKPKLQYRADGFAVQVQREEEIAAGRFDLNAILESRLRKYPERSLALSSFSGLSETRREYWADFLDLCSQNGIKVYVLVPPYHPRLQTLLLGLGAERVFREVSDYLERTVAEKGGVFADYTDIASFGGDPDLFYDEIHMRPANAERLLRALLAEEP